MAKKRTGTTQAAYKSEGRLLKNKTRKLTNHVKRFPKDEQAAKALAEGIKSVRKAPINNKTWNRQSKEFAHILRLLGYNGHQAISKTN